MPTEDPGGSKTARLYSLWAPALVALAGMACGSDGGYSGEGGGGPGTSSPPPIGIPTVGAQGVEIVRVELNQASAAVLAKGGKPTPQKDIVAPVVGGRRALVRGYWKLDTGWKERSIEGILTVTHADGGTKQFSDSKMVKEGTKPLDSGSVPEDEAFNWKLDAADVKAGMQLTIELYEGAPEPGAPPMPPARFPAADTLPVEVDDTRSELTVVVLPATLAGSTPDHGAMEAKNLEDYLYDIFPVQKVNMDLRGPTKLEGVMMGVSENAPIWTALGRICRKDMAKLGVFYQAIIDRSKTGFSKGGSSTGRTSTLMPCSRLAFNLGNYGSYTNSIDAKMDSVAHEFGHNHERPHIDCGGPSSVDPSFPYKDGLTGQQGYRLSPGELMHKDEWKDFMGYCRPRWIADWTVGKLHEVTKKLTRTAAPGAAAPELELSRRSFEGYVSVDPNRIHETRTWFEVPGDLTEPGEVVGADSYAQVWVDGQASPRLAVSVIKDADEQAERVTFTLPEGTGEAERATLVLHGVRVEIFATMIERY
ncbi:MAG: hypothetical protein MJD61_14825 [Proteobacteria bacterium]|nr:hypothetical protein [Pseudomonadota bacterium]